MLQRATTEATGQYAAKHPSFAYRLMGDTGLMVSQVGFGSYRVDVSVLNHYQAMAKALISGVNLIDTSANYADGGSELLIGKVLRDLEAGKRVRRQEIVLVSKVGYLQGQNYLLSLRLKAAGQPFPDLVPYADGLEHCIHPEFIEDQLTRSLERLQTATIDCYLLHNPEYYLFWVQQQGKDPAAAQKEYLRRIKRAFRQLEKEAKNGRIGWYGVSSNTFPHPSTDYTHTSLAAIWETAEAISPKHHFRVIQLPVNLWEPGGITVKNQPGQKSVVEFARDKGLAVLINRPLNAIVKGNLHRLVDVQAPEAVEDKEQILARIHDLADREQDFVTDILPGLELPNPSQQSLITGLTVSDMLRNHWPSFGSYFGWQEAWNGYFAPFLDNTLRCFSTLELPPAAKQWLDDYGTAVRAVYAAIDSWYRVGAAEDQANLRTKLAAADPEWVSDRLSRSAIRALRSTDGITSVLVGMRSGRYVDDILAELTKPVAINDRTPSWDTLKKWL